MVKKDQLWLYIAVLVGFVCMFLAGDFDVLIKAKKLKPDEIVKEFFDNPPGELTGLRGEGDFQPGQHEMPARHDYWVRFQSASAPALKSSASYSGVNESMIKNSDYFLVRCPIDADSLKDYSEMSYLARRNGERSVDFLLRNKRTGVCFFRSCLGTADPD